MSLFENIENVSLYLYSFYQESEEANSISTKHKKVLGVISICLVGIISQSGLRDIQDRKGLRNPLHG